MDAGGGKQISLFLLDSCPTLFLGVDPLQADVWFNQNSLHGGPLYFLSLIQIYNIDTLLESPWALL